MKGILNRFGASGIWKRSLRLKPRNLGKRPVDALLCDLRLGGGDSGAELIKSLRSDEENRRGTYRWSC